MDELSKKCEGVFEKEDSSSDNRSIPKSADLVVDTSFRGRLRRALTGRGYLGLCFIVPTLLMWLVYASMNVFPFGEESVLVLDLNGQYVYYFEALRDILTDSGSFLYSFRRALGGEFLGIIGYYLASPLSLIVALFPAEMMTEALLSIFLLKTGISGLTLGIYLDHTRKRNPVSAVMFSTMYALSAYAVVMQHNTMWIDALMLLPLVILGVEELIKHKKFKLFVITLSISVFSNFYIGFMTCIFVALYFLYYYYAHTEEERNPLGEKNHFARSFIRIGICAILMVAITAVMLWSSYTALQFGKTEFSDPNYGLTQNFDFLDLVSKMYFGSYDTVRPEGWPFLYSGMLTFMLLPLFFFLKKIPLKEKIATGIFIAVMFLCFNASTIDIFWHGMQRPNWLNYRYSFMVCFLFIIFAHRVFENIEHLGFRPIAFSACTIAGVLLVLQKFEYENLPDLTAVWASLIFIAIYLLLMKGITLPKVSLQKTCALILTIFIGFEMYAAGLDNLMSLDDDVVYTSRTTYRTHMDTYKPAFDAMHDMDKSFYRAEKVTYKRTNDNLALGAFGLSNSTSTLNADTIQFLQYLGLASKSHWSKYIGSTPATDTLLGIKYLAGQTRGTLPDYYTEVMSKHGTGDANGTLVHVYQNPYAMSLVFGANEAITKVDLFGDDHDEKTEDTGIFSKFSQVVADLFGEEKKAKPVDSSKPEPNEKNPFERLNAIYAGLLGEESVELFVRLDQSYPSTDNLTTGSTTDHTKYSPVNEGSSASIMYTITAQTDDVIYMYIPTVYPRECKLTVNGASKGTYFGNETHRIVELGSYNPGTILNIKLELDNEYNNLYLSTKDYNYFYYFNEESYLSLAPQLKGSEFNITSWTEDTLEGNINVAAGDELIFTTIPYDEGWKVIADGKEIETFEVLDALVAFRLPAGNHELTLEYRPDCVVYGSIISVEGIVVFVLACIAEFVWNKKNAASAPAPLPDSDVFEEVSEKAETSDNDTPNSSDEDNDTE